MSEALISSPPGLLATEPGISRATVKGQELGLYRLSDGNHSALVNLGPENPREFQEVVSTPEKLRPLAEATGGTVRRIGNGKDGSVILPRIIATGESSVYGGEGYAAIKRSGASELKGVSVAPLAVGFLGLAALLGSVLSAWVFEGRGWGRPRN